ncbi:MAG TPA: zf-HC2 domain-containing protein [Candidatus Eisenbacteria bacterium]|nr:zf-HC2 domain-containing protein [Candidatus Eisenbacteria bacterium]
MTKPDAYHPTSEELFAYRDGELPNERRTHVEAHILVCVRCKERIDEMSALESDLRMRADDVGDEYYERMTEAVLARARQPVPADEVEAVEPATAPAVSGRAGRAKARREPEPPPFDRRRPVEVSDEIDTRRRFRLPWIGIAGSGAAAVAVLIVAVILFQRQQAWLNAPRPSAVTQREAGAPEARSRSDAKRSKKNAPTTAGKVSGEKSATTGSAATKPQAGAVGATKAETTPPPPAAEGKLQSNAQPSEERTRDEAATTTNQVDKDASSGGDLALKKEMAQGNDSAIASGVRQQAAPMASLNETQQKGDQLMRAVAPATGPSEAYAQVLRDFSLPPVWNSSVSREVLLKAEPELKRVYQTHKAAGDSARIRLYLAEAERAKMGNPPDSAHMDAAVNHYRRAIALALAHGDTAVADVARRRLAQLFGVTTPSR